MTYARPVIKVSGGYVLHVELCQEISMKCNRRVHALYYMLLEELNEGRTDGITDVVPAYSSVTVFYDPRKTSSRELHRLIEELLHSITEVNIDKVLRSVKYRVPVAYGEEFGPDLPSITEITGLSEEEVIKIHTSRTYRCYMLGFTPGFVYLGDVDDRIVVQRLPTPRTKIEPGSVGIAGKQTGIYGVASPGGWRLIGRTPIKTFDPNRRPPTPIKPGDLIEFYSISREEFHRLKGKFISEVQ
ncbi:MAG: 5-oxoprolinase subunit PxpB [Desulfurococcales archaeon]|nr:5-oxoprolinase subunit PxpB [Desulfurococcales archaeon]